ncbi:MAG: AAC(3) family N-acetyltransferase [Actinomycetota bacterium]
MTSRADVVAQLHSLGVQPGSVLLVHTSFSAIRPIDGGPNGFIDALLEALGPDGTLVAPSWTDEDDEIFDPMTTEPDEDLGIVPAMFWQRDGVLRGNQPFAFAAIGPQAKHITAAPFIVPPHAPGSAVELVHDLDGWVLLAGCHHDANTTVHLGEILGGAPYRVPKHITIEQGGVAKRIDYGENDSCCQGFNQVEGWLRNRGLMREGSVGSGRAMLMRSRDVVSTVIEELRTNPCRFLHPRGECEDCDGSWNTVTVT